MAKLVSLGILTKNNTTRTSPVMLVSRKGTKNKRPVVDFRLLNTRIMIEKVNLDDLDLYVIMFTVLATSVLL